MIMVNSPRKQVSMGCLGLRATVAVALLACCSLLFSGVATGLQALEWSDQQGHRFAELPVGPAGKPGFSLLPAPFTGVTFTNVLSERRAAENQVRLNGSGVAAGDIDGDGWCDLYFCGLENGNRLYRNLGGWRFEDITESAGVACAGQYSTGAVLADVDGDGDLDLIVNGIGTGTRLFLNDGAGRFTESTGAGLVRRFGSTTLALADIDGDGDLDLYVANYRTSTVRSTGFALLNVGGKRMIRPEDREDLELTPQGMVLEHGEVDMLYLNDGHGRFTPVPWTDGAFKDEDGQVLAKPPRDWGLTVAFRDLNGDGAPDIYVANDFHSPDRVWINNGRGQFRAIDRLAFRHTPTFSMAVDFADINRDGHDDLLVLDMLERTHEMRIRNMPTMGMDLESFGEGTNRPQLDRNSLFLNRGDGTYAEIAQLAGVEASGWSWSVAFIDVDLDGYEDFLITTGNIFNTQDLDANARISAQGPFRRETIPSKLLMYPPLLQPNLLFRNRGDLTFEEVGEQWGFGQVGVSHGMALADLDNDGDLDVVVNNLNGQAGLYRNESAAPRVAVRLKGLPPNTRGIGARIHVSGGPAPQTQEMICGGRYLSGADALRTFAAGSLTNDLTIEVAWRSGRKSRVMGARANRVYEIDELTAVKRDQLEARPGAAVGQRQFEDVSGLIEHQHYEEPFNDYERQPLLANKLSQLGPGVSWFDIDSDGFEDLIIGSGKGGRLAVFRNNGAGEFKRMEGPPFDHAVTRDQTGVLGWRKENRDVVLLAGSANYEDGLAMGSCVRQYNVRNAMVEESFPGHVSSTGPLAMADINGDGNLELFVGGRMIGGRYPEGAASLIFRNSGKGWVLDDENTRTLRGAGMVSGAVWSDLNGDGFPELVLACEWGPVRVFANENGKLRDRTAELGLADYTGWWTAVNVGDFDGDGRLDIVAANWGLNTAFRASKEHPRRLYYGDISRNGTVNLMEAFRDVDSGKWVPERDLNSILAAMPFVAERFPTHESYAKASIQEIYGARLTQARFLEANTLSSTLFLNRGELFKAVPLPNKAQWAPAFGISVADFDGDGNEDIFLSQNFFPVQPQTPRNDSGRGLLLRGDGTGAFTAVPGHVSGLLIYGQQRGSAWADYDHDGRVDLVVTQNGARTKLFRNVSAEPGLRVRLEGPPGNPHGAGACLRLSFGEHLGPLREIHAGSGYWSQDSSVQVLATPSPPDAILIRWPGGKTVKAPVPDSATEVAVDIMGNVKVLRQGVSPNNRQ
jgi:enediyne biosynthesis protein E4